MREEVPQANHSFHTQKHRNRTPTARSRGPAAGGFLVLFAHVINTDPPATPVQLPVGLATNLTDKYALLHLRLQCPSARFTF